jgi:hypothetical protein
LFICILLYNGLKPDQFCVRGGRMLRIPANQKALFCLAETTDRFVEAGGRINFCLPGVCLAAVKLGCCVVTGAAISLPDLQGSFEMPKCPANIPLGRLCRAGQTQVRIPEIVLEGGMRTGKLS